jgi:hypothetical protein
MDVLVSGSKIHSALCCVPSNALHHSFSALMSDRLQVSDQNLTYFIIPGFHGREIEVVVFLVVAPSS